MDTAHYGGPSPWGSGVDRSSAVRFHATADHNRCATIVRAYQAFHMDSRGWADIAYSSLVCPHGHRYEGRGLDARTAAQGTNIGNNTSHATCYIAGDGDPLTPQAMAAYVDESHRLRGLKKGHRDWKPTACPGDPLYRWVHSGQSAPAPAPGPEPKPPTGGMCTVNVRVLRQGSSGGDVRSLQALLNAKAGQGLVVDGDFGPATNRAVRNVQTFFHIGTDGIVGSKTWGVLFL